MKYISLKVLFISCLVGFGLISCGDGGSGGSSKKSKTTKIGNTDTPSGIGTPGEDAGNAGGDAGNAGGDAGNAGEDAGNAGGDAGNAGGDADNAGGGSGNAGGDADNAGGGSGNAGGDADNAGGGSGNAGGDADNAGGDAGNAGGDADNAGGDSGNAGGDADNAGRDADTTDEDITYTCPDNPDYVAVHDVASLKAIANNMAGNYCLHQDIDLAGESSGFPLGWNDIEDDTLSFTGNFAGQDNTISGLTVDKGTDTHIGLFAKLGEAGGDNIISIKNLNLVDFNIKGAGYVGSLAGETRGKIRITNVIVKNAILYSDGFDDDGGIYSNIGGLIGIIYEGGEVNNSSVIGGTVTGKGGSVGGLVSYLQGSKVLNSNATNVINGITNVGGLIGRCERKSTVSNSYATGAVNGIEKGRNIGGLVGSVSYTKLENSYATGNVIAGSSNNVGGLLGDSYGSKMISNNYATGNVTGADRVGGLIGQIYNEGGVSNSYATGMVTATGDKGGLVGKLDTCAADDCSVTNSYFDKSGTNSGINAIGGIDGTATITGLVGVDGKIDITEVIGTPDAFRTITDSVPLFVDWSKDNWKFATGNWPILKWQDETLTAGTPTPTCKTSGYMAVNDIDDLKAIGADAASMANSYCLMSDIDLTGVTGDESGFPLGGNSDNTQIISFSGNFDGAGKTISNLAIDKSEYDNVGLFAVIQPKSGKSSEIKDLKLMNLEITGKNKVGSLAGKVGGSVTISNIEVNNAMLKGASNLGGLSGEITGKITVIDSFAKGVNIRGTGGRVGGLVGYAVDATITRSYANSDIYGANGHAGGLVGDGRNITITKSYAGGKSNGKGYVGGLVGKMYGGKISDTYATGSAHARMSSRYHYSGALVGYVRRAIISNSYTTGKATADTDKYGTNFKAGLIGQFYDCGGGSCKISNSYYDKSKNKIAVARAINSKVEGVHGVNRRSDISRRGSAFYLSSTSQTRIFVGWSGDTWDIKARTWPTFKWQ